MEEYVGNNETDIIELLADESQMLDLALFIICKLIIIIIITSSTFKYNLKVIKAIINHIQPEENGKLLQHA